MPHHLLTVLLFTCTLLSAQAQLSIRPITLHTGQDWLFWRFPFMEAKQTAVAKNINQWLQQDILDNDSIITDSNRIFSASRYIMEDSFQQFGYSIIDYTVVVNNARILSLQFDMESTATYPTTYNLYYSFDSRSGEPVTANAIFTPAALQRLHKKLLQQRKQRVARLIKEELAGVEDSAYIKERFTECLNDPDDVYRIFIRPRSILFYKEFCLPHVIRAYEANLNVEISLRELRPYLTAYGKQVLALNP